ncbi:MAG: hypothetical protein ACLTC8_06445 [Lachnospiraceae bacterium]
MLFLISLKPVIVLGVDFTHNGRHRHSRARVLSRKENTEHRADKQTDKADNNNHNNSYPTACDDSGYQKLLSLR